LQCTQCVYPLYSTAVGAASSATCGPYVNTQLILLRTGDGVGGSCPDAASGTNLTFACARAKPVYLDTLDHTTTV